MSASQNLGGPSSCGRALGPCLDKIVKNAGWRKHSHLVSSCKSVLDKLESLPADSISISISSSHSPLFSLSPSDANLVLNPILLALDSAYPKVVDPALECLFKLFSSGLIRGEINHTPSSLIILKIIESVCKVCGIGDEAVELSVLRVLLAAVRSPCVLIRGECLVHIVRTCYNVYLGGLNGTNQICAKSVLAQIMLVVFTRVEEDSMDVNVKTVSVGELLQFTDKNLNEGSSIHFCQNFVNEVMAASEGVPDDKLLLHNQPSDELRNGSADAGDDDDKIAEGDHKSELNNKEANGEADTDIGVGVSGGGEVGGSKIREDGFLLFRNICKLSMKFSSQETPDDQILLRGKILSLELLKVIMDNGGPIWRNNERQVTNTSFHSFLNSSHYANIIIVY
jgi:brefeldin A-inhibited guanine nucleotide-exchange protein